MQRFGYVLPVAVVLFQTRSFYLFPALYQISPHTHEHKSNLKFRSKNKTALLVAPIESAQSLVYSLSGKDTTTQTLRLTHRLDLRLNDVLGNAIAE